MPRVDGAAPPINSKPTRDPEQEEDEQGYWLAIYKSIHDADRLAAYAKKASVAIAEGGGTFLSRGMPVGMMEVTRQQGPS